jgi:hypothetical protein
LELEWFELPIQSSMHHTSTLEVPLVQVHLGVRYPALRK